MLKVIEERGVDKVTVLKLADRGCEDVRLLLLLTKEKLEGESQVMAQLGLT